MAELSNELKMVSQLVLLSKTTYDPALQFAAIWYAENLFLESRLNHHVLLRLLEEFNYYKSDFNDTPDQGGRTQSLIEQIYQMVLAHKNLENEL